MNRVVTVEINRREYPLCATTKALRDICEQFGSVEGIDEKLTNVTPAEQINLVYGLLELLIDQGIAYRRIFEHADDLPEPLTAEELLLVVPLYETELMIRKVYEAIALGIRATVNAKPVKQKKTKRKLPWQK